MGSWLSRWRHSDVLQFLGTCYRAPQTDQEYFDMAEGTVFGDPGWSITRLHFCQSRVVDRQHVRAAIGEVSKGLQEVSQRKDAEK